jgi:hypothetical protein
MLIENQRPLSTGGKMGKYALVVALVVPIDDNGGKYIAGGFNKTFSINGQPPADRVVILHFAHRGRRPAERKSAAGTRPFENIDKVKAWRTQNPTQKGFPAELIAQG